MNNTEELAQSTLVTSDRRKFLRNMSLATVGTAGLLGAASSASAADGPHPAPSATDVAILNFALNLEYLEAEYYLQATTGQGLDGASVATFGTDGTPSGRVIVKRNPRVKFANAEFEEYANEIALDEKNHVKFIRKALEANGAQAVARPVIDLKGSFNALGRLLGLDGFDPFANETNFLIGAFIFEDVGVTAYKGAAPLLDDKGILEAAAGILGVEAYHAGIIRTLLYQQGASTRRIVNKISKLRASLDDRPATFAPLDQGLVRNGMANLVPASGSNSIAFSRTTRQVLNIVYGDINASSGLFFPNGMNGAIK